MKATAPRKPRSTHSGSTQPAVRFSLPGVPAGEVFLAGTFNDWHPEMFPMIETAEGWVKDLVLPPGTYEYRFVVDGRWMPDPNNPRGEPNPFGEINSVIEVRLPSATAKNPSRNRP